ncbi:MAG: energy transducer TonB, partial [SAR324 cluster bacterium]|nr:energy transducer TonB [SAR324 cluster bacterium]
FMEKSDSSETSEEVVNEVTEAETLVEGEEEPIEVATISKELSDLKDTPLEDLKALEETIPASKNNKIISLAKVLKGFTIDTKSLDLKKIRKPGKLSGTSKASVAEVVTNNATLFAKGRSNIARKIRKLGVLDRKSYLQIVNSYIKEKWKLPVELNAQLEMKVRIVIAKNGDLLQYSFEKVSGNKIFDNSVKSLFAKLKTLPPLPDNFDGKLTELGLKFTPL